MYTSSPVVLIRIALSRWIHIVNGQNMRFFFFSLMHSCLGLLVCIVLWGVIFWLGLVACLFLDFQSWRWHVWLICWCFHSLLLSLRSCDTARKRYHRTGVYHKWLNLSFNFLFFFFFGLILLCVLFLNSHTCLYISSETWNRNLFAWPGFFILLLTCLIKRNCFEL